MPWNPRTDCPPPQRRSRHSGPGLVLIGCLTTALPLPGAAAAWDCRATPAGGWACSANGGPLSTAVPPAEPMRAPVEVTPPEALPALPEPAGASTPASDGSAPPLPVPSPAAAPTMAPQALADRPSEPGDAGAEPPADSDTKAGQPGLYTGVDWSVCGPSRAGPSFPVTWTSAAEPELAEAEADAVEMDRDSGTARLRGNVHFAYGVQTLDADEVVYNRNAGQASATGQVLLQRPEARIRSARAEIDLEHRRARLEQTEYLVPAAHARGTAAVAEYLGDNRSRYTDISYTTCPPGREDWLLTAGELELDHAEGLGTAHAAKLQFLGVPVAYLPTFNFPIDDRRRSGVLVPAAGHSTNTGVDIRVPYYLNLAPNYDATLTPRVMSRRGLALGGQFRFLTAQHTGQLTGEVLPQDRVFEDGQTRGTLALNSHSQWGERLTGDVRFNYASDSQYFEDLGSSLAGSSIRQLERTGELRYQGDNWNLLARLQHYQTLDEDISLEDQPYSRYPQLQYLLMQPDGPMGLTYEMLAEYAYFYKEGAVRGQRIDLYPGVSLPLRRPWGHLDPRIAARYTGYSLQAAQRAGLADDTPDRLLGIVSVDGGLYFDRGTQVFGAAVRQTLEPRLFYLYVPRSDQDDLPVFDTTALDFNFDSLFRTNRFNGPDRQGDANQLTLALVSRTLDPRSGEEVLRAGIGQIYYFNDRTVGLPSEPTGGESTSPLVTEVAARISRTWQAKAGLQWDPNDDGGQVTQGLAQVSYKDRNRRVFNAAYRMRDDTVEQTDLAGLWPVSADTSVIGRWNYSLRDDRTLEALAGVEHGRCCWRVRALVRRFANAEDSNNLAFLLQLELYGLGRLGSNIDDYLERGIYGYRVSDHD